MVDSQDVPLSMTTDPRATRAIEKYLDNIQGSLERPPPGLSTELFHELQEAKTKVARSISRVKFYNQKCLEHPGKQVLVNHSNFL